MSPTDRIVFTLLYALAFGALVFGLSTNQEALTIGGGLGCALLVRGAYLTAKGAVECSNS